MTVRAKDRIGRKYGLMRITGVFTKENIKGAFARCICDCGNNGVTKVASLVNGHTKSCGCLQPLTVSKLFTKHGKNKEKIYRVWSNMITRCTNKKHISYKNYGGRGITVCSEWLDFNTFYKDMGDPPAGLTIDRIKNDQGYSKENCKWSTRSEQIMNSRTRKDNKLGVRGVFMERGKYRVRAFNKHVGVYNTLSEAEHAAIVARSCA